MPEEDNYAAELRGDEDAEPMNVKVDNILPALLVGLMVSGVNLFLSRHVDSNTKRDELTAAELQNLGKQVTQLNVKVDNLAGQPYVRREEFEAGLAGLDKRVGNIERAVFTGNKR